MLLSLLLSLFLPFRANSQTVSLDFVDAPLASFARAFYGDYLGRSFLIMPEVGTSKDLLTLSVKAAKPAQLVDVAKNALDSIGVSVEDRHGVLVLSKKKPAAEQKPEDFDTFVYRPRHRSVRYLSETLRPFFTASQFGGTRTFSQASNTAGAPGAAVPAGGAPAAPSASAANIDRGESEFVVYRGSTKDVERFAKLVEQLDQRPSEVRIKAAIYEVTADRAEGSALALVAKLLNGKLAISLGGALDSKSGSVKYTGTSFEAALDVLNRQAGFKLVTSPSLRVRHGATAKFSVGDEVPTVAAVSQDKNGNPVQSIEYRQSGVILELTPTIGTESVDLAIKQQVSSFAATTTGVSGSPTLSKREVSSTVTANTGEIIMLAGLDQDRTSESGFSLPFLPFRLGSSSESRRVELVLLFDLDVTR
jgi:general secretion pathway protein D